MTTQSRIVKKKMVVILGMHRSGTSLLAAGIESLGGDLGAREDYKSEENIKGFFENEHIVKFNDDLLEFLGGRWDNPLFDASLALENKSEKEVEERYVAAMQLLDEVFLDNKFRVIKDPRMCQLLPFWNVCFKRYGYADDEIYYVHIARHPIEVAKSQQKRREKNKNFYGLGGELLETVSLWASLSYLSARDVINDQNIFISYKGLVSSPKEQIERLSEFLGIAAPSEEVDVYCNTFVDETLCRNSVQDSDVEYLVSSFPEALDMYREQQKLMGLSSFSKNETKGIVSIWHRTVFDVHFLSPITRLLSNLAVEYIKGACVRERVIGVEHEKECAEQLVKSLRHEVDHLRNTVNEKDKDISNIRSEFGAEINKLRVEYGLYVESLKDESALYQQRFDEVTSRVNSLNLELEKYSEKIESMERSIIWKITKPLRNLGSRLNR